MAQHAIAEGSKLVTEAMSRDDLSQYQMQAAIAAVHDEATSYDETDEPQILALYDLLTRLSDNPTVTFGHAVAAAIVGFRLTTYLLPGRVGCMNGSILLPRSGAALTAVTSDVLMPHGDAGWTTITQVIDESRLDIISIAGRTTEGICAIT